MATCCTTLDHIAKACNDADGNASGLKPEFFVACHDQVETIPAAAAGVISTDIGLVADTGDGTAGQFYKIGASKVGGAYSFEPQGEAEDGFGNHLINAFLAKMTAAKNVILGGMRGGAEFIVLFKDGNGKVWLMGDLSEGVTFNVVPGTNDRNGYQLTGTYPSAKLLYEYTGAIVTEQPAV